MRMHLLEDFSLSEIGESLGISRQAAHDNIHRSEKAMQEYESKLGFVERFFRERQKLREIHGMVQQLPTEDTGLKNEILERLLFLMEREREDIDDI